MNNPRPNGGQLAWLACVGVKGPASLVSDGGTVVIESTSDHRTSATGTTPIPLSRSAITRFSCFASTAWNVPVTSTLRDVERNERISFVVRETWTCSFVSGERGRDEPEGFVRARDG